MTAARRRSSRQSRCTAEKAEALATGLRGCPCWSVSRCSSSCAVCSRNGRRVRGSARARRPYLQPGRAHSHTGGCMVPRRSFLTALASLTGVALSRPAFALPVSDTWDLSWLDDLKGRHKQVFAVGTLKDRVPLLVVVNYLDAHREVFHLAYPDINAVVGIARQGFPINFSDALWAKYELGRRWDLKDPSTGELAKRNIYFDAM